MINTQLASGNGSYLSTSASGVEGKIVSTFTGIAIVAFALVIGLLSFVVITGKSASSLLGFNNNQKQLN